MKTYTLPVVHLVCAVLLFGFGCKPATKTNPKLIGSWKSADGQTQLTITDKQFTLDDDSPLPEDYFVNGDTIFTSFEGNQPYTKFVIKKLDDHKLQLAYPDSTTADFTR